MAVMTFLSGLLGGCSGASLDHYAELEPKLLPEEYFNGPIKAWGIVQDRTGKVVRRFDVDLVGEWDGDTGTLTEHFEYYDGKSEKRIWTIEKLGDNQYRGTAGDILKVADGQSKGNAMRWSYEMDLSVDGRTFRITFDDWMFLMNDGVLVNRSYLKKFGFTVAELTLFMQKQ